MTAQSIPAAFTVAPLRPVDHPSDRGDGVMRAAGLFRWVAFGMAMTYL